MKIQKLIKNINKFKEKNESCYCYIEGCGFYNSAFVIPCLETKENIVLHNGNSNKDTFKIYETITPEEFKDKILFFVSYDTFCLTEQVKHLDNVVFETFSEFNKYYGETYASVSFSQKREEYEKKKR